MYVNVTKALLTELVCAMCVRVGGGGGGEGW